ncbi:MAG: hypothetical protein BGP24_14575 [Lysobacterales bacterium 69-70]|nr:MAG: hypothetical protein ABT27_17830 [Xanthomonadaceae bacterium SCN 69-25]OJY94209.1 MAG: hypothetical protein BGP24_14575 [Xanthomonadales bacterium 69-70]
MDAKEIDMGPQTKTPIAALCTLTRAVRRPIDQLIDDAAQWWFEQKEALLREAFEAGIHPASVVVRYNDPDPSRQWAEDRQTITIWLDTSNARLMTIEEKAEIDRLLAERGWPREDSVTWRTP